MYRHLFYERVIFYPIPSKGFFLTSVSSLDALIQDFHKPNTAEKPDPNGRTPAGNSAMLEKKASDAVAITVAVAMNNDWPPTPSSTLGESGSGTLVRNTNSTDYAGQTTHVGEVNGALSWAESAYHSFWFFAWALTAVAIAIGTQML